MDVEKIEVVGPCEGSDGVDAGDREAESRVTKGELDEESRLSERRCDDSANSSFNRLRGRDEPVNPASSVVGRTLERDAETGEGEQGAE